MAQSLKELKAENAASEEETEIDPQLIEVESEVEAVEEEAEQLDESAETEESETEETEAEAWMQSEEQTSQDADEIPNAAWKAARQNYKAKLDKKQEEHTAELEQLRAENERLKGTSQTVVGDKPKREDFYSDDDPDGAYFEALSDWKVKKLSNEQAETTASAATTQRQQEFQQATNKAVDQHYERAVNLAEKSGISAELYQSSDLKVRQMVDSVFPQAGDVITDTLIANLGEGSERVLYNLGVNSSRLSELHSRLVADPSGVKAAMYLGQLKAELASPQKRKTNAPKPVTQVRGDEQTVDKFKAAKKKYADAHKRGDTSAAFKIKREAKKAGAETMTW